MAGATFRTRVLRINDGNLQGQVTVRLYIYVDDSVRKFSCGKLGVIGARKERPENCLFTCAVDSLRKFLCGKLAF